MNQNYSHAVISRHCKEQLAERNLPLEELLEILQNCDDVLASGAERVILHKTVLKHGKTYLWRVVVDIT